jgi:hypothetical protein
MQSVMTRRGALGCNVGNINDSQKRLEQLNAQAAYKQALCLSSKWAASSSEVCSPSRTDPQEAHVPAYSHICDSGSPSNVLSYLGNPPQFVSNMGLVYSELDITIVKVIGS